MYTSSSASLLWRMKQGITLNEIARGWVISSQWLGHCVCRPGFRFSRILIWTLFSTFQSTARRVYRHIALPYQLLKAIKDFRVHCQGFTYSGTSSRIPFVFFLNCFARCEMTIWVCTSYKKGWISAVHNPSIHRAQAWTTKRCASDVWKEWKGPQKCWSHARRGGTQQLNLHAVLC